MERVVAHRPNLKWYDVEDQYSAFDMETDNSIVELKRRTAKFSHFSDCMVEKNKIDACMKLAMEKNKRFLFIVYRESDDTFYTFDVSSLILNGYDFQWYDQKCRKTTSFKNTNYVTKRVGKLYYSDAVDTFKL